MSFISMRIKNHFLIRGFALSLTLKQRLGATWKWPINSLSPNSDQHQFSPNNVHMLSREMVMRLNKMVTKEKML